jgi:hypothetical protein
MAQFATINGVSVTKLELRLPLNGAWDAEAEVVTTNADEVTGAVTLKIAETELRGVSTLGGTDAGNKTTVRIVAGAGGLANAVEPNTYGSTTVGIMLAAILVFAGERLDPTADPTVLAHLLPHWVRASGDVAEAIRRLAEEARFTWRFNLAGELWLGTDTWPEIAPDYTPEREAPTEAYDEIAIESLGVLPGKTFRGKRVSSVEYTLDDSRFRARVAYGAARDEFAAGLALFTRRETAHVDYFAAYDVRIVGQNPDGTVEIVPDTPRLSGSSAIPLRGLPGVEVKIAPGTRALLRFGNGSPARPYVSDFEPSGLLEVKVTAATKVLVDAPTVELGEGATEQLAVGPATLAWITAILAAPCASPGSPLIVTPPPLYPLPSLIQSTGPGRTPK